MSEDRLGKQDRTWFKGDSCPRCGARVQPYRRASGWYFVCPYFVTAGPGPSRNGHFRSMRYETEAEALGALADDIAVWELMNEL